MSYQLQLNEKNFTVEEQRVIYLLVKHRQLSVTVENILRMQLQSPTMATVIDATRESQDSLEQV